jgi:thymidylate kinase
MIIEFLGNSGSGKSTLIPVLLQSLRDNGLVAMSVTEAIHFYMRKMWLGRAVCRLVPQAWQGPVLWRVFAYFISKIHLARFFLHRPRLVIYVLRSQLWRPIPWPHRHLILRLFLRMVGAYQFLTSQMQQDEIVVFDEGFAHRVVHMFASESEQLDSTRICEYLELIPRSDWVVWVQTPLDVCLERIYARGLQIRLRQLGPHSVRQFMQNVEQAIMIASRYLMDAGWQIIQVSNDGQPDVCAAAFRHTIMRFLRLGQDVYA